MRSVEPPPGVTHFLSILGPGYLVSSFLSQIREILFFTINKGGLGYWDALFAPVKGLCDSDTAQ